MSRLSHILNAVYCDPWLIRPEMHARICEIVEAHMSGAAHAADGIAVAFEDEKQDDLVRITDDGVAIIGLRGVVGKRVGSLEKSSGVTDVDDVAEALAMAVEDGAVRGVVMDIDSPGGTVTGVPELAAQVRDATDRKNIVAFTDTQASSAAYWIGSQAYSFVAAPSASVGSVGVYLPVLDSSRAYEAMGLRQEVIKSGRFKGAGIPGTALTEEQRQRLQERVNAIHAAFRADVRAMRKRVPDEAMEGQELFASEAIKVGMVDMLGTMREAVRLARG